MTSIPARMWPLIALAVIVLIGLLYYDARRRAAWDAEDAVLTAAVHQHQQERHVASVALIKAQRTQDSVDARAKQITQAATRARNKVTVLSSVRLGVQRDSDGVTELVTVPPEVVGAILAQDLTIAAQREQLAARDSVAVTANVVIRTDSAVVNTLADDADHLRKRGGTPLWKKLVVAGGIGYGLLRLLGEH
jgi:hypothetical protein